MLSSQCNVPCLGLGAKVELGKHIWVSLMERRCEKPETGKGDPGECRWGRGPSTGPIVLLCSEVREKGAGEEGHGGLVEQGLLESRKDLSVEQY